MECGGWEYVPGFIMGTERRMLCFASFKINGWPKRRSARADKVRSFSTVLYGDVYHKEQQFLLPMPLDSRKETRDGP